ncbi:DUF31 family protein [Mycoplasma sp. 744]|uniref:Ig-specific serine endopeptidase MIP n=1 Tax=Mycoplasma sp. 744 TaxID=3108531 RepID=UPI002B1E2ABB|nr:DUF31 family protein [Mycoplasma sp. 744]MEA4115414.1 DUF31 family protein [Mycoplasma sp. 744]
MKRKFKLLLTLNASSIFVLTPLLTACVNDEENIKEKKFDDVNTKPSDSKNKDISKEKNKDYDNALAKEGDKVEVQPSGPNFLPNNTNTVNARIPGKPELVDTDYQSYNSLSPNEKSKIDLEAYIKALSDLNGDFKTVNDFIKDNYNVPSLNDQLQIDQYNEKAKQLNLPDYQSSILRNFSFKTSNDYLFLNPIRNSTKAAYWNSQPNNRGLPRYLPNELYKKVALESFAIEFSNSNDLIEKINPSNAYQLYKGTAWILDYELDENNYPTKWYLATNAHVAAAFLKDLKTNANTNDRFTNFIDQELEYEKYVKFKAVVDKGEAKWKEINDVYDEPIERLLQEKKHYLGLRQKAETDNDQTKVAYYQNLMNKITNEDLPKLYQEKNAKVNKQWETLNLEFRKEYDQAKRQIDKGFLGTTKQITLTHFNENTPLDQWLNVNDLAYTAEKFTFKPEQVKLIYAGVDFLKTSPKDYVDNTSELSTLEESADFAVLEFNFKNSTNNYSYTKHTSDNNYFADVKVQNAQELAKIATSNFADWKKEDKFTFSSKSLKATYKEDEKEIIKNVPLTNGTKADIPKIDINLIALGFPLSNTDNFIERKYVETEDYYGKNSQSLWINKPFYIAKGKEIPNRISTKEYGNGFNKALSIRNHLDMPGILDYSIVNPLIHAENNKGYQYNFIKDNQSSYNKYEYTNYGLGYSLNSWQPLGGASGSSLRTIDNKIVGINFATADASGVSLTTYTQALRSEKDTYQGFYGKYQLEEYDLIYGGGENQRTSYREALKSHNEKIKTWLFPNGLEIENIPTEFRFNK